MRAQPAAHTRSDRAWVSRCLEQTTASLRELHVMRLEAEDRVRGVLEAGDRVRGVLERIRGDLERSPEERIRGDLERSPEERIRGDLERSPEERVRGDLERSTEERVRGDLERSTEERIRGDLERSPEERIRGDLERIKCRKYSDVEKRSQDLDRTLPPTSRSQEFENIQEEVLGRLRRSKLENLMEMSPPEDLEEDHSPPSGCFRQGLLMQDLVEGAQAKGHTRKLAQWSVESPRPSKTTLEQSIDPTPRRWNQAPADMVTNHHPWLCQSTWGRAEGQDLERTMEETMEQSEDPEPLLSVFPTESTSLRRMGSGSLAPRLRLGSSGVTSDLLFTRRMSGNCLSAHSSGFYETSDLDSTSSSCSSLCSDISCHTSVSMMSPRRNSVMRPRSIDCTMERRKELQSGSAQTKRPMSAGALDGFLRCSRYDLTQSYDAAPCDHAFSGTPPLSAILQRRKTERYICKLALKYRCKPGGSSVRPDLGPPTPRRPAHSFLSPVSRLSCPSSPQVTSLSTSLMDVRKHSTGSWGRFLSRVMLKKDSRIAASELNLEQCWKSSGVDAARSPSLAEGQFVRAKSFRDLLSVNPFKRSQRGLNKVW